MKYFLFLVLLGGMASCNSGGGKSYVRSPVDTTRVIAAYLLSQYEPRYGEIFEISKDSLMFVNKDSLTLKKEMVRYKSYWIMAPFADLDSLGKPKVDSLGNTVVVYKPMMLPDGAVKAIMDLNIDSFAEAHKQPPIKK